MPSLFPGVLRPRQVAWSRFSFPDLAVTLGTLLLLYVVARVGAESLVRFNPPHYVPVISLNPTSLPNYAARSTLRMFVALAFSFVFSLVYGYIAASSRRAERLLVPLLDVLQSVPVLGFLSITVTAFIALFRGSLLGLEAAAIFAIFTGQAWNMTFSFYHSLRTVPRELHEMSTLYRLSRWERFTRVELPSSAIGLTWNAMMSFGGGWFFLAASEAITVLNSSYTLPGLGSYVAAAVAAKDLEALAWAIGTMIVLIVAIDQFFWRPLVTLVDLYKLDASSGEPARFWVNDLWRAARVPKYVVSLSRSSVAAIDRILSRATAIRHTSSSSKHDGEPDRVFDGLLQLVTAVSAFAIVWFVLRRIGAGEVLHAALLGLATFGRVIFLIALSTLVWAPVAVVIGFRPKLAKISQPIVQILASFPANFLFPLAALIFLKFHIGLNWGSILLMALGAQWYLLFNLIGGVQSIPNDLREMGANLGLRGVRAWKRLIAPGIFASWVTGAITASGGAWNASIVSEIVSWGDRRLTAQGLGAYIADATTKGDWPRIVLGVGTMSIFVVTFNRLIWRRLYALSEDKYRLG
jgi:NitT/TauT family transport system permease protein